MVSVQSNSMHRMLQSEEARRMLYLSSLHPYRPQQHQQSPAEEPSPLRVPASYLSLPPPQPRSHSAHSKRQAPAPPPALPASVSRRNARERKRVRLVNMGFSTLRDHVPQGAKNKKLSKVETLRAAIEYIRQLQGVLGMTEGDEGTMLDDCSSIASSEEAGSSVVVGEVSPASSYPSDYSLMSSPYTNPPSHDEHLLDMGHWFS